jgi:hypothetical protein
MQFNEYCNLLKHISIGKNLPNAIYLHKAAFDVLPKSLYVYLIKVTKQHVADESKWDGYRQLN